jgi:MFS transporter, PPP family, 3-phenylpropionic acid transporter
LTPPILERRAIELRLALIYGAIFLVFGVQVTFLPVWLNARGFPVAEIGLVLACPRILQVVVVPALTRWADKRGGIVAMLLLSCVSMTLLFAALATSSGPAATLVAVGLLFLAQTGSLPLIDVLAFALFPAGRRVGPPDGPEAAPFDYGRTRKWGSLAYIGGNLLAGVFLTLTSLTAVTFLLTLAAAAAAVATFRAWPLDRLTRPSHTRRDEADGKGGSRLLPIVIAAAAAIQASHVMALNFGAVHWAHSGHSNAFIGAAWAIGVAVETMVFALFGRWVAGPDQAAGLMIVGGLTATARWIVMAFDPGDLLLMAAQASHGLTFAATHAGTMLLVSSMAPADRRARAQGWLTAAIAGLSAALTMACGPLIVRFGEHSYLVMAAFASAGTLLAASVSALRAPEPATV